MKDRFVKLVDGNVKLISQNKIDEDIRLESYYQSEIDRLNALLEGLEAGPEKDRILAELASVTDLHNKYVGAVDDNATYNTVQVADSDFNDSGSLNWWVIDSETVRKPTTAEKDAREQAKADAKLEDQKAELWDACYAYQLKCIDVNTEAELSYARALVAGGAPIASIPKAQELGNWKKALYGLPDAPPTEFGTYYGRKNALIAGQPYSLDFSDHDPVPSAYQDLALEIAAYEASL